MLETEIAFTDRVGQATANAHAPQPRDLRFSSAVLNLAQNQEIYGETDRCDGFFRVVAGVVRTCRFLSDGRRQVDDFLVAGDLFGFEMGARRMLSAEAACPAAVIRYRYRPDASVPANDDELTQLLFAHALRSLARAQEHAVLLGRRTAVEKVAAFLIDWTAHSPGGEVVLLSMTRNDIADYLGLTVETISRTLALLQRHAFLELSSARRIRLKNVAALRLLAS